MGYRAYAKVVVGCPTKDIYQVIHDPVEVTRFNEETGKSYQKIMTKMRHVLFGKHIESKHFSTLEEELTSVGINIKLFRYNCEDEDESDHLVGFEVKEVGAFGGSTRKVLDQTEIDKLKQLFFELTGFDAKVYLTMYHSY